MWKLQFDHQSDIYYYFQAGVSRTGQALQESINALSDITVPLMIAAGQEVYNTASNAWEALSENIYLSAMAGRAFTHDIADIFSAGFIELLDLIFPGCIELVYMPEGETELPTEYTGGQGAAIDDGAGFAWSLPTASDKWSKRWFVAARSIYRDSGFFRPEFAFIWTGSVLGENHILTRCMSTGPFQECDGYYGHLHSSALWYDAYNDIWHPRETWYDVPGPTYPLGYWDSQIDPYGATQTFYLTEWQEGIDLEHDKAGSTWSMDILLPVANEPFFVYPVSLPDSKPRRGRRYRRKLPGLSKYGSVSDFDDLIFSGRGLLTGNNYKGLTIGDELVTL